MSLAFLLAPLPGGGDDAPVESCSNLELDQERRTKDSFSTHWDIYLAS